MTKIKPFISKYNWEGINYPSEKDDWKKNYKNDLNVNLKLNLNVLYEKIYILLMFQNITKTVKNKSFF